MDEVRGRAMTLGDDVDTDQIYPSRFLEETEFEEMGKHALAGIDPELASTVADYEIIVAGRNFGCGSSREHAPRSLKQAGIRCLLASSFARIFYRNAINIGLPALELRPEDVARIRCGDHVVVMPFAGRVRNTTRQQDYSFTPITGLAARILKAGGLVPYERADRGID